MVYAREMDEEKRRRRMFDDVVRRGTGEEEEEEKGEMQVPLAPLFCLRLWLGRGYCRSKDSKQGKTVGGGLARDPKLQFAEIFAISRQPDSRVTTTLNQSKYHYP